MKPIFLTLFFLTTICFGQKTKSLFPYEQDKIVYSEVIELDSTYTQALLFDNAILALNDAARKFNNQITNKQVWGLTDFTTIINKDAGELVGVSRVFAEQAMNNSIISFDVYLFTKDGKYKYTLNNFNILGSSLTNAVAGANINVNNPLENVGDRNNGFTKAIDRSIKNYISDLKAQMGKKKPTSNF